MRPTHPAPTHAATIALVGAESSGKSTLAASWTSTRPRAQNLPGSTVMVQHLTAPDGTRILDTPGVLHGADSRSTRETLALLEADRDLTVVLVVRATHLDDEVAQLLPLVAGRPGALVVTGWDRVQPDGATAAAVAGVAAALGVPHLTVDARAAHATDELGDLVAAPGRFTTGPLLVRAGWRLEPPPTVLERRVVGPVLGLTLLLAPAVAAVTVATGIAGVAEPAVESVTSRAVAASTDWHPLTAAVVTGDYGLVTMGPLLVVWALPTVLVLALLLGVLKASGLLDRLTTAVHPLVRPFGLTGRDLVRVVAGAGCNVPAVLAARSCSACSQVPTTGAIAFGAPCSYQLAAALAVLSAVGRPSLLVPYLAALLLGGLLHARWLTPRATRRAGGHLDLHLLQGRAFLVRPRLIDVRREAAVTLHHATGRALPVFAGITVLASSLAAAGLLDRLAGVTGPLLSAVRLPADAALPIVAASVRKDGALLLTGPAAGMDGAQLVAALLLAGALLPCLVTAVTILREHGPRTTARLVGRQAALAVALAGAAAWSGVLVAHLAGRGVWS